MSTEDLCNVTNKADNVGLLHSTYKSSVHKKAVHPAVACGRAMGRRAVAQRILPGGGRNGKEQQGRVRKKVNRGQSSRALAGLPLHKLHHSTAQTWEIDAKPVQEPLAEWQHNLRRIGNCMAMFQGRVVEGKLRVHHQRAGEMVLSQFLIAISEHFLRRGSILRTTNGHSGKGLSCPPPRAKFCMVGVCVRYSVRHRYGQ